ncbi:MAG: hypothetical protein FE78DRAFT_431378 [Acidomyces sp. 'richmondensis']|nr:MAG: hypothetical protein FE78DRAFT_431378 [Acidomyces sp. 'richmondensis']
MGVSPSEILMPFLGALQASISVLLVMLYGWAAAELGFLDASAARKMSRTSVTIFLPALLIYNIGSELKADTILRYVPILFWALFYNIISIAIGQIASHIFQFPRWATSAITFNNTSSMPLLLVQSLKATGLLSSLLASPDDTTSAAVTRARSYFLACAVVGNTLTFGIGPAQLKGHEEDSPYENGNHKKTGCHGGRPRTRHRVRWHRRQDLEDQGQESENNSDTDHAEPTEQSRQHASNDGYEESYERSERSPLLSNAYTRQRPNLRQRIHEHGRQSFQKLPSPLQRLTLAIKHFINPPFVGAVIGLTLGLAPPLHRLFFNPTEEGGYFNAWLSQSIQNVGELFIALQVVIVGVKLSAAVKDQHSSGGEPASLPWLPFALITFVRFIMWPAISISLIWALAAHTNLLGDDPILWFAMMLMPVGPTAMKLMALADVTGSPRKEKNQIAKFLALTYGVSPLISLAVVGALKAADAAMAKKL